MRSRSAALLPVGAILASGLLYLPSLGGGYVYDDFRFVARNPAVQEGVGLARYFTDPETQTANRTAGGIYRPLRTLSFRAVRLLAPGAGAQRLANLLLHLLNALLVWRLLRRSFEKWFPPLVGALAFSLHPLATEPVAWISGRGDLLALTGMLGALLLYLRGGAGARVVSVLLFLAALLSKESAVVLPILLVAVDLCEGGPGRVRARLPAYVPYVLVLAGFAGARWTMLGGEGYAQGGGLGLAPGELAVSLLTAGLYYVRAVLLPAGLAFELELKTGGEAPLLAGLGAVAAGALSILAFHVRRRARPLALAVAWFLVALLPVTVLQLLFPLKILVANRFAYPALVAAALLLAWISTRGRAFALLSAVVLAALVPLSAARARVWREPATLWADVAARDPGNPRARLFLARAALREGRYARAREMLLASRPRTRGHPKFDALLGEACESLAARRPFRSPEQVRLLVQALQAYEEAGAEWRRGSREDRNLLRPTLLSAALLAANLGRRELSLKRAEEFVRSGDELAAVPGVIHRLDRLIDRLDPRREGDLRGELQRIRAGLRTGGER